MDLVQKLGLTPSGVLPRLNRQVNIQLIANGFAPFNDAFKNLVESQGLLDQFRERGRLLADQRCPADQRIEAFLASYFRNEKITGPLRLPDQTLVLHRHGIAKELSLPEEGNEFASELLTSFRLKNGVLHNPKSDRRTTKGTFHVAEGGLPVPEDKQAVPKLVFAAMFQHAMNPPADALVLPFTAGKDAKSQATREPSRVFVSLLLRPIVCPEVPGYTPEKTMEVRFFAPGTLVSNLDFVESIFGNAGDPFLPENDAGLDVEHWTGHTGCVILAPHLTNVTKKEVGLPHWDQATARQKRDGMCWKEENEKYNNGVAFKLTCRDKSGVIVTLIADNYYGYCKKEVKTQISYAANLYGNVEEEHAGGAIAFNSYSFGDEFIADPLRGNGRTFVDVIEDYSAWMDVKPEGYAIDKNFPDLIYIPTASRASVRRQQVWWTTKDGKEQAIPFTPGKIYMSPSGFKIRMEKHPGAPSWRIIGTRGEGTVCHKPCTVSGGGKSEISKSLVDYMLYGPLFVADVEKDLDIAEQIFKKDYSKRWRPESQVKPDYSRKGSRSILGPERSLGSVIKLLTPSTDYTDEYNAWLASLPSYIYPIVFIIKRFYRPEWGENWREHFSVDEVNGNPGHELKYDKRKLVGTYLRVGLTGDHSWRTYKVRQDFAAAMKVQIEDDISASVVAPAKALPLVDMTENQDKSYKFVVNCESRLFQRPDDAIHRGLDKQTELDMSRADNFISNFQPLTVDETKEIVEKVTDFDLFTAPMKTLLQEAAKDESGYVVCSAIPRIIDGKPSKNPRYLQIRPDLMDPMSKYVAEMGARFFRAIPADKPLLMPVDAILVGRRNNPEDKAAHIRGLAVYNPIHYQELPELFMDFICSLTGKSPSTTGAGTEGAMTKAPFNAVRPTADLNAALVSYILTGLGGFSSSAGFVGPHYQVDHDVSLLMPEIWCRLTVEERDPEFLKKQGYLEPVEDVDHKGERVLASRLGYRITSKFVRAFFGRIFDNPGKVFDESILKPEKQDMDAFIDGVKNITETQQRVAQAYLKDGMIEDACPPLKALLKIMAEGMFEGKDAGHADIRRMFTRENLLSSDWYRARLAAKQRVDIALWKRHLAYLDNFLLRTTHRSEAERLQLSKRRDAAVKELERVSAPSYVASLVGTLGTDPTLVAE
jgi:phosphoenolpyruvate carboxykinase (diphosphate)